MTNMTIKGRMTCPFRSKLDVILRHNYCTRDARMADGISVTKVACDLLQCMPPKQDVTLSPLSIFTCLAMTYGGAQGKTAKEMQSVLHIESDNIHQALQIILRAIIGSDNQSGHTFKAANRLFFSTNYSLLPQYLDLTKTFYNAQPQSVNFSHAAEAAGIINTWVENQTAKKIKDLIPASGINPLTRLILVNALYFKGNWSDKFDKNLTQKMDFKIDNSNKVQVHMMSKTKKLNYMADMDIGFQMVELPYAHDSLSMFVILPRDIDGINSLCKHINSANLQQWIGKMSNNFKVKLSLPRFKMTFETTLSDALKSLGMHDAFNELSSDFSKMTAANDLYISEVYHKTFIEVNEEGTEAAAATGVMMMARCCLPPMPPEVMLVDHPFIFMIFDKSSKAVLFMGKVYNPKE
ncbi:Serpin B9 [Trichoplax sp. H2]|nr:Serpin B9 [Trichoplax sp. H2]|eukprot:RDD41303.1 Serpin B9 [Trichoplax sp. H2]